MRMRYAVAAKTCRMPIPPSRENWLPPSPLYLVWTPTDSCRGRPGAATSSIHDRVASTNDALRDGPTSALRNRVANDISKKGGTPALSRNLSYDAGSAYKSEQCPTKEANELSERRRAHSPGSGS